MLLDTGLARSALRQQKALPPSNSRWLKAAVQAGTGLLMWFENFTLTRLPGWVPEAANVLHFYEAVLAALAICIWHFYSVIFDPLVYPFDPAAFTGRSTYGRARERGETAVAQASEESSAAEVDQGAKDIPT